MTLEKFQKLLENELKKSVKLVINDNRSTMLSVKWEPHCTKVSLHRFFLNAPQEIMDSLAGYITREQENISQSVKTFIEVNMHNLDYSHEVNPLCLETLGKIYDLTALYDGINATYFDGELKLHITWFGEQSPKYRSRIVFGLYHGPLKLIKINRILDDIRFPEYFISYVLYHEMLHFVCRSYYDKKGKHRIHSDEFKKRERQFEYYGQAQDWLKRNREHFFSRS